MKHPLAPRIVHLRIGQLTVDATAMEGLNPAQFSVQLQAALALQLSSPGASDAKAGSGSPSLAQHIAVQVASRIQPQLPTATPGGPMALLDSKLQATGARDGPGNWPPGTQWAFHAAVRAREGPSSGMAGWHSARSPTNDHGRHTTLGRMSDGK